MKLFSATEKAFYDSSFRGVFPNDVKEVSDVLWKECYLARNAGHTVIADENGDPVIIERSRFTDVVSEKMRELAAAYAAEITGDIEYNGVVYQGDQRSLDALQIRLQLGTDPPYWRAKDNSNIVPFTIADVDALRAMIELRAATAVEKLHSRKDAVLGIIAQVKAEKSAPGTGITESAGIAAVRAIAW